LILTDLYINKYKRNESNSIYKKCLPNTEIYRLINDNVIYYKDEIKTFFEFDEFEKLINKFYNESCDIDYKNSSAKEYPCWTDFNVQMKRIIKKIHTKL
jgi:hypothetical protein